MHDDLFSIAREIVGAVPQFVWAFLTILAVSYVITYLRWMADERYAVFFRKYFLVP